LTTLSLRLATINDRRLSFARALIIAVFFEALVLAFVLFAGFFQRPQATRGLRAKPMAVHFVTLPTPPVPRPVTPPARPIPRPRPQTHPVLRPRPRPVLRPVVRKRSVTQPLPEKPVPPVTRPSPPPRPVAAPSPAVVAELVDRYAVALRTRIQAGLLVPARVAALGLSGQTLVAFKLTPSGRLLWARVLRTSGIGLIDRASLAAVRARHFPAFSAHMPHHALVFQIRVGLNARRHQY